MLLSPNGRWLVLSYMLHDQAPLLVRLDRQAQTAPTVERGMLGGPPADDGTLYYVEQEAADMARLLVTPADDRRSYLRRWDDGRRLIELHGAYGVHNVDDKHFILWGGGNSYDEVVVATETGAIVARKNFTGPAASSVLRSTTDTSICFWINLSEREDHACKIVSASSRSMSPRSKSPGGSPCCAGDNLLASRAAPF